MGTNEEKKERSDETAEVIAPLKESWKYPRWMKRLGFGKKKDPVPHVNPNLLNYPEHVIYAAISHPKPPPPDEKMQRERKEMFLQSLGYVPGEKLDADGHPMIADSDEEEEEEISPYGGKRDTRTKYQMEGTPYWAIEMKNERDKIRKLPPPDDWWTRWGLDEICGCENPFDCKRNSDGSKGQSKMKRKKKFKKKRMYYCCAPGTLP